MAGYDESSDIYMGIASALVGIAMASVLYCATNLPHLGIYLKESDFFSNATGVNDSLPELGSDDSLRKLAPTLQDILG